MIRRPPRNSPASLPLARAAVLAAALAAGPAAAREESPIVIVTGSDRARLATEIRGALARHAAVSAFPLPALEDERLAELFEGGVVRFREKWILAREGEEDEQTRQRVLAFRLAGAPRRDVWLSAMDPHFLLNDRLTEIRIEEKPLGASTWYQFMDLPWPVRNRHWVIELAKGLEVCAATGGEAWEQSWRLVTDGEPIATELAAAGRAGPLSLDDVGGARYLDANDGAWAIFDLGEDLTLVAYNLTIVLGGWIPEGMAARFAMRALEDLLDRVARNAEVVPTHYIEGHAPLTAGDGTPIPFFATPGTRDP